MKLNKKLKEYENKKATRTLKDCGKKYYAKQSFGFVLITSIDSSCIEGSPSCISESKRRSQFDNSIFKLGNRSVKEIMSASI